MIREEAKRIIKDTFENSFNKQKFSYFAKNLLKDGFEVKEFSRSGQYIKTAFKDQINKFERIGKYTDNNGNVIDVVTVELTNANSVERARTTQRNFIRWYLNGSMGDQLKDAALVAFYHPESSDWRFSFIKMQYSLERKKDEFAAAKRYSYLVGKSENSYTAQVQLIDLLRTNDIPTLEQLQNSFSIEKLTKRFFDEYKELFFSLKENIDKILAKDKTIKSEFETKQIDTAALAKKTLGQIVFLYFLQKKGWLGVTSGKLYGQGDKRFLQTLFEKCQQKGQNFFNDHLKFLFYDALAIERPATDKNEKDFYQRFNCKIPFLNDGFFEPLNEYDWQNINQQISNTLFYNSTLIADGEEGTGILNVFDRYNFTIKEDEPLEKEVAVDPEMLGKVFENLLEVTDRKAKGAFYTPREIVHYMCQESLINYLDKKCNSDENLQIPRTDIEIFIRRGVFLIENDLAVENQKAKNIDYQIPESIRKNTKQLDQALADVLICDPAIGSGAFPVGLLTEIVNARIILYKLQNPQIANDYDKLEKIICDYKRHCIHNSIYGVDIDNSAIDIAKLRLWLSLVVDEHDYSKIKPLPNLDYKIVCGNSLLSIEKKLFNNDKIQLLEKKKDDFFICSNRKQKHDLKEEIEKLFDEITEGKKQFDFQIYFSEVFRKQESAEIKILNAQIEALNIQIEAINEALQLKGDRQIVKLKLATAQQQITIIEKEINNIEKSISTIYCEIKTVNNNIAGEPKNFDYLISAINKNIKQLNDKIAGLNKQLQNATNGNEGGFDIVIGNPPYGAKFNNSEKKALRTLYPETQFKIDSYSIFILKAIQLMKSKAITFFIIPNTFLDNYFEEKVRFKLLVENQLYEITDLNDKVFEAVVHSMIIGFIKNIKKDYSIFINKTKELSFTKELIPNSFFREQDKCTFSIRTFENNDLLDTLNINSLSLEKIVDIRQAIKSGDDDKYISNEKVNSNYKPILGGKHIGKWTIKNPNLFIYYGKHLACPRDCEIFEQPKILIREAGKDIIATYDDNNFYIMSSLYNVIIKDIKFNLKYILALINSRLYQYLMKLIAFDKTQGVFTKAKIFHYYKLPVKNITLNNQKPFIQIVDYILWLKKNENLLTTPYDIAASNYFESVINGMVYELYFEESVKKHGKDILKYLTDLPEINENDEPEKTLETVRQVFNDLYNEKSPVGNALYYMDMVQEVRIIENKDKNETIK